MQQNIYIRWRKTYDVLSIYDHRGVTIRRKRKTETERNVQVEKIQGLPGMTTAIIDNKT